MDNEETETYFSTEPMEVGDIMKEAGEAYDIMVVVECNKIEEDLYWIKVRSLPY